MRSAALYPGVALRAAISPLFLVWARAQRHFVVSHRLSPPAEVCLGTGVLGRPRGRRDVGRTRLSAWMLVPAGALELADSPICICICNTQVSTTATDRPDTPLTRRAIALFCGAGPAEHREAALHPRASERLRCHCQRRSAGPASCVLTGASGSPPALDLSWPACRRSCCAVDGCSPSSRLGARTMRTRASRSGRGRREQAHNATSCSGSLRWLRQAQGVLAGGARQQSRDRRGKSSIVVAVACRRRFR